MEDATRRKRALVVDDASITRTMLCKMLAAQGFACIEAATGEDAIKIYNTEHPELVVLDIHIDRISGMGVLQVILRLDPQARVVIVSSESDRQIIDELMRIGAKAFVPKPFQPETLTDAIARALA